MALTKYEVGTVHDVVCAMPPWTTYCLNEAEDRGDQYRCVRPAGHTGRHMFGDGVWIHAVWSDVE